MKLLAFIPIRLTLLLILGILIGSVLPVDTWYLLLSTLLFFLFLTLIFVFQKRSHSVLFGVIASVTVINLGMFCFSAAQPINHQDHYSNIINEERAIWTLKIKESLKPNLYSTRYFALVTKIDQQPASGTILLTLPQDSLILNVDDEIQVFSKPYPISPSLNPHQFDYKNYLKTLGVYDQLSIKNNQFIRITNPKKTLTGIASRIRSHIISQLQKEHFGADELGVIQALLLGQRDNISEETYSNYQKAGAVHILAVSGLHIGILLLLIQFIFRPLRNLPHGRTVILISSVVFLWIFAFIAGLSASIVRATTMFSFVAYALYLNRPSNTFNILALSILFILLFIDPNLIFQVGFQMSYAAVFSILWIFPMLRDVWFPKNRAIRYFWQLLCVSIAAQLGVLPISLFYFHQFPGLFFISNLIIVPALGLILGTGIIVILLSLLNALPLQLAWFYNTVIAQMNGLIGWIAQQEQFIFSAIPFDSIQLILSFLILILGIELYQSTTFKRTVFFLISIIIFQGYTLYETNLAHNKNEVLVLHQTKNSIILNRNGQRLSVLSNQKNNLNYLLSNYTIAERIKTINKDSLKNSYSINATAVVVIDSSGVYQKTPSPIILLTNSPKINIERLALTLQPLEIIADGSNYKSYVDRWKTTCIQYKIPFHYTGEKGAYYLK
ncbi:ComEC/Rec2 family competence protein [Maribacter sp. MAR_2009_72]|uniref:ComEC/Rec2 family competence protein n=1 Tax=Maribacter sp. MAR_2009_72 TaxID=1250050 RepID=UPI0011A7272D|nr:ComEC/Rec2 family competence protein [Maribacter sp. MAR_2009_72]